MRDQDAKNRSIMAMSCYRHRGKASNYKRHPLAFNTLMRFLAIYLSIYGAHRISHVIIIDKSGSILRSPATFFQFAHNEGRK